MISIVFVASEHVCRHINYDESRLQVERRNQNMLMKFCQFACTVPSKYHHQIIFAEARHPMHIAQIIVADAIIKIYVSLATP